MQTVEWTATTPLNVYRGRFTVGDNISDIDLERRVKEAALNEIPIDYLSRSYSLAWKYSGSHHKQDILK